MKFLVLALCVYSASAAVPGYRGYQNPWQASAQAVVQTGVPVAQAVGQAVIQPAVIAKKVLTGSDSEATAEVLKYDSEVDEKGFKYGFETQNGISASSTGFLKNVDNTAALVFEGGYRYINPDGTTVELSYTADENGYQPRSDIIPVGPPTPDHVVRLLKFLEEHPQPVERINY